MWYVFSFKNCSQSINRSQTKTMSLKMRTTLDLGSHEREERMINSTSYLSHIQQLQCINGNFCTLMHFAHLSGACSVRWPVTSTFLHGLLLALPPHSSQSRPRPVLCTQLQWFTLMKSLICHTVSCLTNQSHFDTQFKSIQYKLRSI